MSRELHIVGFHVGRETYGVPITSLHEIVRVPEITAVPDAPDYLEGVINLRGKIVSVMDLRKRFGDKQATIKKSNRILVVEHSGRLAGLIVDSAREFITIPAEAIQPPPESMAATSGRYLRGVADLGGRIILLLDIAGVLDAAVS